jgi:GNAT superfamily N-acetyltransferase
MGAPGASPALDLRPVAEADLPFLAEMALLAAFPPGPLPIGAEKLPRVLRWTEAWGRPGDAGVVAWQEGARIGAAWCRKQREAVAHDAAGRPLAEVAIAVLPDHRGGVGASLLQALETEAAACGVPALSLTVNAANPARRLYERSGYVLVARDGDSMVMVLDRREAR